MTNTGTGPVASQDTPWEELQLIDDQGRTFSYAQSRTQYLFGYNSILTGDLQPNLPANGFIVFELPPDASGFEMAVQGTDQRVPVESLVE